MKRIDKVFAYITHGDKLLIFSHPNHPEAGLQVPAGTVESGETWREAVLREAFEETGLMGLDVVRELGERLYHHEGKSQLHSRRFFHLNYKKTPPQTWERLEKFGSDGNHHLFRFFWVALDAVPPLVAKHDALLPLLVVEPVADARANRQHDEH